LCLHHNDADGLCAAAIVRRRYGDAVELREIDYGLPIPWDKIEAAEAVIMVDFSLPRPDMLKLRRAKGQNFVWIDHHLSALNDMAGEADISGLRRLDAAACVLAWEYYFPEYDIPPSVRFIGDRDIWRFAYLQTQAFCEGLFYADTAAANDALWQPLLNGDEALIQTFIDRGEILLEARLKGIARHVQTCGFETTFAGHKTLAVNLPGSGDVGHYICGLGFDIAYVYSDAWQDGQVITNVSLYSETVDVSQIAKTYGGGGHKGAAGFRFVRAGNAPFPDPAYRPGGKTLISSPGETGAAGPPT
ncbi:MAG: DHH family phosphoesterase, partial [Anaerolineae bacterium]